MFDVKKANDNIGKDNLIRAIEKKAAFVDIYDSEFQIGSDGVYVLSVLHGYSGLILRMTANNKKTAEKITGMLENEGIESSLTGNLDSKITITGGKNLEASQELFAKAINIAKESGFLREEIAEDALKQMSASLYMLEVVMKDSSSEIHR